MKTVVHVDFETRSEVNLKTHGGWIYANDKSTDALCMAYAFGDGPVKLWEYGDKLPAEGHAPGEFANPLPDDFKEAMLDPDCIFVLAAHNANFEFLIFNFCCAKKYGWPQVPIHRFDCTMIRAYNMGLPGSLDKASKAVGLKDEKDGKGHRIMMQLCKPRSYIEDGTPIWYDILDDSPKLNLREKYKALGRYCIQDVIVERALDHRLLQLSPTEKEVWFLDQKINNRGVHIDIKTAERAIEIVSKEKKILDKEMKELTGGKVPTCNSAVPLRTWINSQEYFYEDGKTEFANQAIMDGDVLVVEGVAKDIIHDLLDNDDLPPLVREVLELRKVAAKNSTAKLNAMIRGANSRGRCCGLMQYYGAPSTGRWAGRRVQTQNMPRPVMKQKHIEEIFSYFENQKDNFVVRNYIDMFYGSVVTSVSDILRGMICAAPGNKLVAADWSAIEGRVLAWLAGQESTLTIYRTHGKIYEHTACQIYGLRNLDDVSGRQRLIGKVATLALGYQGGVKAFHSMAKNYFLKISDEEADVIKKDWRLANPHVVSYWYDLERAAISSVQTPNQKFAVGPRGRQVIFLTKGSFLFCRLPSGRAICYPYPKMKSVKTPWDEMKNAATYMGLVMGKWVRRVAYGGLLAENITQAVARDLLSEALPKVEKAGYSVIMHVHDEIVTEVPFDFGNKEELENIMCELPTWAKDLPIAAEGWEGKRFRK